MVDEDIRTADFACLASPEMYGEGIIGDKDQWTELNWYDIESLPDGPRVASLVGSLNQRVKIPMNERDEDMPLVAGGTSEGLGEDIFEGESPFLLPRGKT